MSCHWRLLRRVCLGPLGFFYALIRCPCDWSPEGSRYSSLSPYVRQPLPITRSHVHSYHVQTHSKYNSVLPTQNGLLRWVNVFNNIIFFVGTAISVWTGCLYLSKYIWQIQSHFRLLIFAQVKASYPLLSNFHSTLSELFLIQNLDEGFNLQLFISLKRSNSVMKCHVLLSIIYNVENLATYIWNPQFL